MPRPPRTYLERVDKGLETKGSDMKNEFRIPSGAELYAVEQLARRERARAQAAILRMLFSALKESAAALFRSYDKRPVGKAVLHG